MSAACMEMDIGFFLIAIPAVIIAGISKGGFGGGAAFVATPILALRLEPAQAIGLMLPLLMIADVTTLGPYWRKWDWPSAKVLMAGGAVGVLIASVVYQFANADLLRVLIGAISVGFVLYQLARHMGWLKVAQHGFNARLGLMAGVVAGFTSFVSHAGGPPAAMYLLTQKMDKTRFQATTVITFWAINGVKAVPYAILGIFTWETLRADLYLAPVMVGGAVIGVYLHRLMPQNLFFAVTYVLLLGAGSKLLFDGLT